MGKVCVCGADWNSHRLPKAHTQRERHHVKSRRLHSAIDGTAGEDFYAGEVRHGRVRDCASAWSIDLLDPKKSITYSRVREVDEVGG